MWDGNADLKRVLFYYTAVTIIWHCNICDIGPLCMVVVTIINVPAQTADCAETRLQNPTRGHQKLARGVEV